MNKNNKILPFIVLTIIGLGLIIYGIVQIAKTNNYLETMGNFSYSSREETTDSKGHTKIYYIWYYEFIVNNKKYIARSDSEESSEPFNKEEKILYNPTNPNENLITTDYTRYVVIIAGIIFLCTTFFFIPKQKKQQSDTATTSDAKAGWYVLLFSVGTLLIIFMKANFNIDTLLKTMLFPTIIMAIFIGIGIFLIKRVHNPEMQNVENANNSDLANETSKVIDKEQLQKVQNIVYKGKGIWQIISGIIWCIIVFFPQIISAFFVLLSVSKENPTYTLNGEEVTALQFIFGSVSIIQLIALALGILRIAIGIRNLISYKKDNQNIQ